MTPYHEKLSVDAVVRFADEVTPKLKEVGTPHALERHDAIAAGQREVMRCWPAVNKQRIARAHIEPRLKSCQARTFALARAALVIGAECEGRELATADLLDRGDPLLFASEVLKALEGTKGVARSVRLMLGRMHSECALRTAEMRNAMLRVQEAELALRSAILQFDSLVTSGRSLLALAGITVHKPRAKPRKTERRAAAPAQRDPTQSPGETAPSAITLLQ